MPTVAAAENRIFQALADPSRRAIFESLTRGEAAVKDLTARFDISQPAVSQHLATLKAGRPGEGAARGALRLLPRAAARDEAAHRLDRALSRLLDGARRPPRTAAGDTWTNDCHRDDRTVANRMHFVRVRFASRAARRSGARSPSPALLAEWLLPVVELELAAGSAVRLQDAAAARVGRRRALPHPRDRSAPEAQLRVGRRRHRHGRDVHAHAHGVRARACRSCSRDSSRTRSGISTARATAGR